MLRKLLQKLQQTEFFDMTLKSEEANYYLGMIIVSLTTLIIFILWNIWRTGKPYANLPTYHRIAFEGLYEFLANKPKPRSFNAVLFHKIDEVSKLFQNEGMFHFWCFKRVLVIFGEEAVKVFATERAAADKPPEYEVMKEGFGEGLVTSNGETWRRDRKMLNPFFSTEAVKDKLGIFNKNANMMIKKLAEVANKSTSDLLPSLRSYAFHNLCESLFGISMKDAESEIEIQEFFDAMLKLEEFMTSRFLFPPVIGKALKFCLPTGWKCLKLYKQSKQLTKKILNLSRDSISCKPRDMREGQEQNRKYLSEILQEKQSTDPSFTTYWLESHVNTFTAAGSDTVFYSIQYCLFLLGHHKDVQMKAYDEVQSIANEFITYENLCEMKYLDSIIKETLRLYPTAPLFGRYLKKDIQCGKYTIPKSTTILFFLYRLFRDPEIYPDPEKFDPDRFRSTNAEMRKGAFIPFSEGYRTCIGKKFAMTEIKVALAYFLQNYEVTSLDRKEDLDLSWKILMIPTKPIRMLITPRKH